MYKKFNNYKMKKVIQNISHSVISRIYEISCGEYLEEEQETIHIQETDLIHENNPIGAFKASVGVTDKFEFKLIDCTVDIIMTNCNKAVNITNSVNDYILKYEGKFLEDSVYCH